MTRVGTVTITIEPHMVEATMYAVKASKLAIPQQQGQQPAGPQHPPTRQPNAQTLSQPKQPLHSPLARPVLQYGPPNGSMPPPPTPTPAEVSSVPKAATPKPPASPSPAVEPPRPSPAPTPRHQTAASPTGALRPASPPLPANKVTASPGITPRAPVAQSPVAPIAATSRPTAGQQPSNPPPGQAVTPQPATTLLAAPGAQPPHAGSSSSPAAQRSPAAPSAPAAPAAPKPAANDPVIALLAQRASGDSELRDLMKRVAVGQAREGELAQFQKIIDQLNVECKQKSGQPGPSAEALLVDGRTVKYFADEVRTILDIVLASNPNQKSTELRPPPRSDPLVVLLVKTALEDQRTKNMIRRIAEGRPGFTDAQDLKEILDRLHRDAKTVPKGPPPSSPSHVRPPTPNGVSNGHAKAASSNTPQHETTQALRSKGPPPAAKSDISAVVFDFGSGDRYLFPKYSILESLPTQTGQQVIASFLIVRKGSTSEYGGDPSLDYYQPVTIRLSTTTGRHLENLARAVASQEEVRRYMNDVMDNMTRAEYVLLAMRLPRAERDGDHTMIPAAEENGSTPKSEPEPERVQPPKLGVLWASSSASKSLESPSIVKLQDSEQQSQLKYERLIRSVAEKDTEAT